MKLSLFLDPLVHDRSLAQFLTDRTLQALKRHSKNIERVDIRIRDLNATKGGVDKECKIIVFTPLATPIVVSAAHSDPGQAYRAVLKKLLPNLRDKLDRRIFRKRRDRAAIRSLKQAA